MHIEDYEWVLYLRGSLSKRRRSEIEAHLLNCDKCLFNYTKYSTGEDISDQNRLRTEKPWAKAHPVPLNRWFAMVAAVLILFVAVSFTPQGRIALANFWVSLEKFGDTLSGMFGIDNQDGVIDTVNQTIVNADGIEIKVDQVFVESEKIFISMFIASDLLEHEFSLQPTKMELYANGEKEPINLEWSSRRYFKSGEEGNELPVKEVVLYGNPLKDYSKAESISFHLEIKELYYQTDEYIKGPWIFNFETDVQPLAEKTRIIPLKNLIHEKTNNYEAVQLMVSPIRTQIVLNRLNPPVRGKWFDEDGNEKTSYGYDTNIKGFLIRDENGNEADITTGEFRYFEYYTKSIIRYNFYSSPTENPYHWLKDAESIEVIPYVSSLDYKADQKGLKKFKPLETDSFIVQLQEGQENEE